MKIAIVLGSSRSPRLGDRVCAYVLAKAVKLPDAEFTVLDLAGYGLPFFDMKPLAPGGPTAIARRHLPRSAGSTTSRPRTGTCS